MKLKSLKALPLLAAALIAGSLSAPVAYGQELSDAHLAAARRAVIAAGALQSFDEILPILAEQTKTIFVQADPSVTPVIEEVTTNVALALAERRPELNRIVFEVWARRLSEEELAKISEFYESPVGKKLTELGPELTALSIGAAQQWQEQLGQDMVNQVRAELEKRGLIKQ
ncbi:DUF2059 domain-containing protein [Microvirga tunisiensis]|uniref:DUF2059 domain-containing protein n=2 Tax=Pannonibacter tanglangensis TaxID=2750084 RepID=A0A7X5F211_9HYPH|nr:MULTISPECIES: DUF2059 domain-containing protein [unclassified Pannonibacter]NBN62668.1 DUF2059 domain-containing protein [Pannonibacter sp. XCT-34]NBN78323.1 DUF2059 domain-containing protein [Pannonibacter sp. XCT-53]